MAHAKISIHITGPDDNKIPNGFIKTTNRFATFARTRDYHPVVLPVEAKRDEVLAAFSWVTSNLVADGQCLVSYCGHGLPSGTACAEKDKEVWKLFKWSPSEQAVLERVLGAPALPALGVPDSVLDCFSRVYRGWSAGIELHHLASLSPRGAPALRVVASTPFERLLPTIEELGWQGDASAVHALLTALGDHSGRVTFDLDLADGPSHRLGIEWYLPTIPAGDPRWRQALAVAGELAGGCAARIAAAEAWANERGGVGRVGVRRYFQLKFVLRSGAAWATKAYLGVRPALAQ
ncbi:MAG: hypothetical protein JNL82_12070 [Myxococcales bacterium]|nr:hypothetical protein [Myxococcales bacterium]